MSTIGSQLLSFISASNENYAALANLKVDFSLFKIEAPVEFNGIAAALSPNRRVEAEEGHTHKTARRLGALFEDLVPSTPKLISAYGLRMSEIMNTSGINEVGTNQHGPFEPYVGADGTSLWAAATSGIPALGVYLLSCLLARAWNAKDATAIWVELVAARRNEIKARLQTNHTVSESSMVGACQDITRHDLAVWDNSARAWLRRADKAKTWERHQLKLIVENIKIPFSGGPTTYEDVISVWKRSMLAAEQFISGKPQEIVDGSVFLAFSSWHLYPDLLVLGAEPKKVKFRDTLIPSDGVGTIGLESRSSGKEGFQWSLALSHLQYYGDPVMVRSDQDYSRITFAQLQIIALGGLLGRWRVSPRDYLLVAEWFILFWSRMGMTEEDMKTNHSSEFGWLRHFVIAANRLLDSQEQDHQQNLVLLKYGTRRAKGFLSDQNCNPPPFFGLLNNLTTCGLKEKLDIDSGVAYLRAVAEKLGLERHNAIICCAHGASYRNIAASVDYFEVATARPSEQMTHARWICPNDGTKFFESSSIVSQSNKTMDDTRSDLQKRVAYITDRGEKCDFHATGLKFDERTHAFSWSNPPWMSEEDEMRPSKRIKLGKVFHSVLGDWRFGLFVDSISRKHADSMFDEKKLKSETFKTDSFAAAVQNFKDTTTVSERLKDYMSSLMQIREEQTKHNTSQAPGVSLFSKAHRFTAEFSNSVYALDTASIIYGYLGKATISLKLITRPLFTSKWTRCLFERWEPSGDYSSTWLDQTPLITLPQPPLPDRLETFSCIALFDSGAVDLSPQDFEHSFALCSEDTIYVPAVLLSDPFTRVPDYKVRSITGNIGRQGISILVSPFEPRIRELSSSYNLVKHEPYDLRREDNFRETSLHLSFTDWTFPLATESSRMIDHDAHVVEAVISIHDRGRWVADIDILEVDFDYLLRLEPTTHCDGTHNQNHDVDYTSIDSWEELLDEPHGVGVFRAHKNWAARLAAVSILSRSQAGGNNFGVLGPEPFCLKCLEESFDHPNPWTRLDHESMLPSFCID